MNKLHAHDENAIYTIDYSRTGNFFKIVKVATQQDAENQLLYECESTYKTLKSVFLVFGLCGYKITCFLSYIQEHEILTSEYLSPEDTSISYYE